MKKNNLDQNKFKRFLHGVKLGIKFSLLPPSVEKFQNYPITRVFRVLGGISILLVLSGSAIVKSSSLFYFVFPLAFLQFIYIISISVIKFCYYIYIY